MQLNILSNKTKWRIKLKICDKKKRNIVLNKCYRN